MELTIDFPGGKKVEAHFGSFTVRTDQPPDASAPTPFALFLSSIGTCAGIYVLGFCRQRGLPTEGLKIIQRNDQNPATGLVEAIVLEIALPEGFPEKYREAVIHSAELCAVKKHLEQPPRFKITTS
jgi:putative redox protein